MIVLDTNVLSELLKANPKRSVIEWVEAQPRSSLYTTTVVEAELLYGLALLPDGARKAGLESAVAAMFNDDFSGRVIPFDSLAAHAYSEIASERKVLGRPISQLDAMIAAAAMSRRAGLATRNTRDFLGCGIDVIDPWVAMN